MIRVLLLLFCLFCVYSCFHEEESLKNKNTHEGAVRVERSGGELEKQWDLRDRKEEKRKREDKDKDRF